MTPDPVPLAQALIRCRSVTPADGGALDVLQAALVPLGFDCTRLAFGPDDWRVHNLFARRGSGSPHLCYAGHTDVVPPGDLAAWADDPFAGNIRDGVLYGRGACDMKGGIAAFVAGLEAFFTEHPNHPGSISLLITGDEEARSVDGTARVLDWLAERGALPDMAIVGEPTSRRALGDTIKIGRRGSLNAWVSVQGVQGHSAYPTLADNPIHRLIAALHTLVTTPLDAGSAHFPPSTLQVTGFDVGNATSNVIPGTARAMLNIRFNDHHTSAGLIDNLHAALRAAGADYTLRTECSGESFVTQPGPFVDRLVEAIRRATNETPALDTGGGTSDARFFARHCPVAEFGGLGTSLHAVNECVAVAELHRLADVYRAILAELLA